MEADSNSYLTKKQAVQRYPFLTDNVLKDLLFKNTDGFRDRVVRRLGRKVLLKEEALLKFLEESK